MSKWAIVVLCVLLTVASMLLLIALGFSIAGIFVIEPSRTGERLFDIIVFCLLWAIALFQLVAAIDK